MVPSGMIRITPKTGSAFAVLISGIDREKQANSMRAKADMFSFVLESIAICFMVGIYKRFFVKVS